MANAKIVNSMLSNSMNGLDTLSGTPDLVLERAVERPQECSACLCNIQTAGRKNGGLNSSST
jgi:hypothetical protein